MGEEEMRQEHEYFLSTAEGFSAYLSDVFKDSDFSKVTDVMAGVVLSKGIGEIAQLAKVTRVSLYRGYVTRNDEPSLKNFLAVLDALGVQLRVVPKAR